MFKRLYRALDARYPPRILAAAVRLENVVVILGVAGLGLYVRVGFTDFLLLAALGVAGQEGYALSVLRYFRSRLAPVQEWIGGERTEELGAVAWTVAASMPFELLRFWWRGVFAIPAGIAWAVFATWLLGLAAWSIPILFLAAEVVLAYGNWIAFFLVERAMQPLLDDLATQLSDETEIDAVRLPLRVRLLTALPAVRWWRASSRVAAPVWERWELRLACRWSSRSRLPCFSRCCSPTRSSRRSAGWKPRQ
jgi:hypothetical protein